MSSYHPGLHRPRDRPLSKLEPTIALLSQAPDIICKHQYCRGEPCLLFSPASLYLCIFCLPHVSRVNIPYQALPHIPVVLPTSSFYQYFAIPSSCITTSIPLFLPVFAYEVCYFDHVDSMLESALPSHLHSLLPPLSCLISLPYLCILKLFTLSIASHVIILCSHPALHTTAARR